MAAETGGGSDSRIRGRELKGALSVAVPGHPAAMRKLTRPFGDLLIEATCPLRPDASREAERRTTVGRARPPSEQGNPVTSLEQREGTITCRLGERQIGLIR